MTAPTPARRRFVAGIAACLVALGTQHAQAQPRPRPVTPRGDLSADERATIEMFERAKGSVVHISARERVFDFRSRNVLSLPRGTGSGFIWDEQGHVITNWHVISEAAEARVRLNDGREFAAALVGASPSHDLAVLRIRVNADRPPPLPLGRSSELRVGQRVYAIGNPFGLDWSLSTGIVSALNRSIPNGDRGWIEQLIQTDAAINPGNSGGPLLDSAGRLIGVNTAIFSPSGASAGIGFAVPSDIVNRVVTQLIATGRYVRPTLGIETDDALNDLLMRQFGVEGVFVLGVVPRSPAATAGLRGARITRDGSFLAGDVIVAIDDRPVDSLGRFEALLDVHAPGDRVRLTVLRDGRRITVDATLAAGS